jgi:hypothetical protein
LSKTTAAAASLPQLAERFAVGPNPGTLTSYTVSRDLDGQVTVVGTPMTVAQTSVRVFATLQWGAAGEERKSRTLSTLLTKGGL